jgi:hypothetical protein
MENVFVLPLEIFASQDILYERELSRNFQRAYSAWESIQDRGGKGGTWNGKFERESSDAKKLMQLCGMNFFFFFSIHSGRDGTFLSIKFVA